MLLREDPGQRVLRQLLKISEQSESAIDVITQRMVSGCIPDMHFVQGGFIRGLLEVKFWADFTEHQLSGAYCEAAPNVIFLFPEERIKKGIAGPAGEFVRFMSWQTLLQSLREAAGPSVTRDALLFSAALEHLWEFCDLAEQQRFHPLTVQEIGQPPQTELERHLMWLVREVISETTKAEIIREAGRLGAGFDSFFFYGQLVELGTCRVWLGYWPHAWKKKPELGPLWIQFSGPIATKMKQAGIFGDGNRVMDNDLAFPLLKASSGVRASQEEEVVAVAAELNRLKKRLADAGLLSE